MNTSGFNSFMLLLFVFLFSTDRLKSQDIPAEVTEFMPVYGQHTIASEEGTITVDIGLADFDGELIMEKSSTYIECHLLWFEQVILFLNDKLEKCTTGCTTRKIKGEPYLFNHADDLTVRKMRGNSHIRAHCETCTGDNLKNALQQLIVDSFGLTLEYTQVPVYSVCQDFSAFLKHFHSGDSTFVEEFMPIVEYKEHNGYLEIRKGTLNHAVKAFSNEINALLRYDPDCKNYSRGYYKPFRIKLTGSVEEKIEDFEENNFVELKKVEGETWQAMILRQE